MYIYVKNIIYKKNILRVNSKITIRINILWYADCTKTGNTRVSQKDSTKLLQYKCILIEFNSSSFMFFLMIPRAQTDNF